MWPWTRTSLTPEQFAQLDQILGRMDLLLGQQRQILQALARMGIVIPPLEPLAPRPRPPASRRRDVADVVVMSREVRLDRQAKQRQEADQAQIAQTQANPLQT